MTTIYLVRHAHSTYTPEERSRPLSQKGTQEANKACKSLAGFPIDVILSSPYQRAVETVQPLAASLQKEIRIVEGFKERKLMEGGAENFDEAIRRVWSDETFSHPGGESNEGARRRGVQAINEVLYQYEGQHVAIGTHGNIMALVMGAFDSRYDFRFWKKLQMPDIYALTFNKSTLEDVTHITYE
ncbi:histidine phosphatase family protein [Halobacillus litoralis]|uniref:histidine phosphatase family protein n=1 Tax=Halobacillus litoralis TaxID=45668 RepID=UPI001CD54CAA|nr:histidine phosphatase family protein [Halobacillus litoralis]MCA0970254.1 histidine phosphatase family protein [Halobacillus litoralis]